MKKDSREILKALVGIKPWECADRDDLVKAIAEMLKENERLMEALVYALDTIGDSEFPVTANKIKQALGESE